MFEYENYNDVNDILYKVSKSSHLLIGPLYMSIH
jgi:hypothetical protein